MKLLLFLIFMILLGSCGVKGDPMPPIDKTHEDRVIDENKNKNKTDKNIIDETYEREELENFSN